MSGVPPGLGRDGPARPRIHEVVSVLIGTLGATVVQAITAATDPGLPKRWAGGEAEPTPAQEEQLRLARQVWLMIERAEGPSVARAWMIGANPHLGEDTPLTAIRERRRAAFVGAAVAFLEADPYA